jgi:hypothetical protein
VPDRLGTGAPVEHADELICGYPRSIVVTEKYDKLIKYAAPHVQRLLRRPLLRCPTI